MVVSGHGGRRIEHAGGKEQTWFDDVSGVPQLLASAFALVAAADRSARSARVLPLAPARN